MNCFMKKDLKRLQQVQNQLGKHYQNTPTLKLLERTNNLSIHQIGEEAIVNQAKKIIITGKPEYLKKELAIRRRQKRKTKNQKKKKQT